jgi:hypothetical protein
MSEDDLQAQSKLLLEEFQQAWEHYRHLESGRSQYVGFFFTVLLASAGFGIPALTEETWRNPGRLLEITGLLWLFSVVAISLYIAVRRNQELLWGYENIIARIRCEIYGASDLNTSLNIRNNEAVASVSKLMSIQRTSEYVILLFVWVSLASLIVTDVQVDLRNGTYPQIALASAAPFATLVALFSTRLKKKKKKEKKETTVVIPADAGCPGSSGDVAPA